MTSANVYIVFSLIVSLKIISSAVWLRHPNVRGPAAVNAGTKCLNIMSEYYFHDRLITRTTNLAYFHSTNLSAPSADIGLNFLVNIHSMVAQDVIDGLQVRVISDVANNEDLNNIEPQSVMFTDYFVFIIDDVAKFFEHIRNIVSKLPSWNPGARFLLLFNNPDLRINEASCYGADIAAKIFELMYHKFNVARVVILYCSGIKTYNVFVTNPYKDEKDCREPTFPSAGAMGFWVLMISLLLETLKPLLIDVCENGVLKNGELTKISIRSSKVPEKLPSCTFTFCVKENEPFINENCTSGLEIDVMRVLQGVMQFRTKTICSTLPRGEPIHNGSWTGLLGLLRNDQCDFTFGGFFPDNEVHDDFGHTSSYFEDTYTWFIYLAPLRPKWKGLIEIFQSETWLLLILTLFIAGVSWFVFGKTMAEQNSHKKLLLCVMNSLAVLLGISSNNRPNFTPLRVFFIILALYGLNITTIYTSKLITVFTQPAYDQQISTIQEILDAGIPIGGQEEYTDWFENDNPSDQIILKKYNKSDRFQPTLENMKLVQNGNISILSNRIYVLSQDLQDDIFGLPGNVFSNQLEMIAERGFPLIKKFNFLINLMKDGGLTTKIYQDFLYDKTILDFIRHRERIANVSQITLTLEHLEGAFDVFIVGSFISFVIFLIEILLKIKCFIVIFEMVANRISEGLNPMMTKYRLKEKSIKLRKRLK